MVLLLRLKKDSGTHFNCPPQANLCVINMMSSLIQNSSGSKTIPPLGFPGGNVSSFDSKYTKSIRTTTKIGTWNVQGLLQPGKLTKLQKETNNTDIVGICETHWRRSGYFRTVEGNTIYFSGHDNESINGVAIMLSKQWNDAILSFNPINDRIMLIKLNTKPVRLNVVQIYAPTSTSKDEVIENFYKCLEDNIKKIPTRELTIIQGDFNAKIKSTKDDQNLSTYVGKFWYRNKKP